jgi:hypothetical protein
MEADSRMTAFLAVDARRGRWGAKAPTVRLTRYGLDLYSLSISIAGQLPWEQQSPRQTGQRGAVMRVEAGDSRALGRRRGVRKVPVRPRHALFLSALLLLLIAACSAKVIDVETIRAAFERAGLEVGQLEPNTEPEDSTFFAASSELFRVRPNGALVDLFRFASPEDASGAASKVSDNGYSVPVGSGDSVAMVEWAGQPHLFIRGRVIALYVSSADALAATTDETVLRTLRAEMGQEFAGGSSGYVQPAGLATP